ncbi:MAG: hypothetical protein A2Y80_01075 [Deltaproteobacteria bacterium RBG_13_58_19]|nr:MAG: hypothetical protein A2Y80_01075 [Deltaproteobacteria bacterium RBG_13_58_19]
MTDTAISLTRLFPLPGEQPLDLLSPEKAAKLQEALARKAPAISWSLFPSEFNLKVIELLDIDLADIFVRSWNKYRILKDYADPDQHSPDETILVPLGEHTIKSEQHPHIDIFLNETRLTTVDFQISLSLVLKGIILKLQGGRITEILAGSCQGKGSIKCENQVLFEGETKPVLFPGSIKLGEGIAISP